LDAIFSFVKRMLLSFIKKLIFILKRIINKNLSKRKIIKKIKMEASLKTLVLIPTIGVVLAAV